MQLLVKAKASCNALVAYTLRQTSAEASSQKAGSKE